MVFVKGQTYTSERNLKISKSKLGFQNPAWKGDNITYAQLHKWIRGHKPKLSYCEMCGKVNCPLDIANKSGKYKRDLNDWLRLCVKCHEKYDLERIRI
jgi:hypothetical protein